MHTSTEGENNIVVDFPENEMVRFNGNEVSLVDSP